VDRFGVTAPMLFVLVGLLISGDTRPTPKPSPRPTRCGKRWRCRQPGGPWGAWPNVVVVPPEDSGDEGGDSPDLTPPSTASQPLQTIKAPHPSSRRRANRWSIGSLRSPRRCLATHRDRCVATSLPCDGGRAGSGLGHGLRPAGRNLTDCVRPPSLPSGVGPR
jgi:hypothetical protein